MIERLLHRERGVALIMAVSFMALSLPLVLAALHLASALTVDSRVKTDILKGQYAALAGQQYARYRLDYEDDFPENLPLNTPQTSTISINGKDVTVRVKKVSQGPPPPSVPPSESGREFRTHKSVQPATTSIGVMTTFTYTITAVNTGSDTKELTTIYDQLPSQFTYVVGSTSGVTTDNPQITGPELKWEDLEFDIPSGGSTTLTFQAQASRPEGTFCNEAWVDPGGVSKSTSGLTAGVVVGSPSAELCPGKAVTVTKSVTPEVISAGSTQTFTYTISIANIGEVPLPLKELRDLLPAGFSYVLASSSGISSADPSQSDSGNRKELKWAYSPEFILLPRATTTQAFQAVATPDPGNHYNEVWLIIDDFPYEVYTWPTAGIRVMSVVETCSTDAKTSVISNVWVGPDSSLVDTLEIIRAACP